MRIAIFTNNYLPIIYGVPNSVETFRHNFEKMGHEVFIFAPQFKGYQDNRPNVFRYPSIDIEFKIRFPLAIPYSRKMDKIIEKLDLDVIHSQHPNLLGSAAKKWALKKKIPLIFTWHTLYDHYAHFAVIVPPKIAAWFMVRGARNYANSSDSVVVPTDSIIPILKNWGVEKEMTAIPTGVVEEEFSGADGESVRKKYGISKEETVLLLVSRLTGEKNVEFVFRSLKKILQSKKAKFLVAGEGNLRAKLESFCQEEKFSEAVIFGGLISREEIKNYYAATDIFVYSSKSETQGMIVTEAMYMGLPVVALRAPGVSSLVLDQGSGFLVEENEAEFALAVERLINDRNLRQRFSENSKKLARENYTSDITAKKMIAVYEKAIAEKRKIEQF